MTEAQGVPVGLAADGANRHDMKLVRVTVDSVAVSRPVPSPEHPQGLCLDKGYDFAEVRRIKFGFTAHIRSLGEEAQAIKREAGFARRWVVDRFQLAAFPAHPGALGQVSRQLHRLSSFRLRPHRPQSCRVIRIGSKAPKFGQRVAIDSTDIEAYASPKKKVVADQDARWGVRTAKNKVDNKEYFFGYKLHLVCDAYYWTPLAYLILPGNSNDSRQFIKLFKQLERDRPGLPIKYVMADRGYDALPNYQYLDRRKILSVIHMRNTDKKGIYTASGEAEVHDPSFQGCWQGDGVRADGSRPGAFVSVSGEGMRSEGQVAVARGELRL